MGSPARPSRVPLRYVVIGVTLYCAIAWAIVITALGAGVRAFQHDATHYAQKPATETARAE